MWQVAIDFWIELADILEKKEYLWLLKGTFNAVPTWETPGFSASVYISFNKRPLQSAEFRTTLGTILGLGNTILLPICLANERARLAIENNLEKYRESLRNVPEADVVPVRAEVSVPILEKLMYVTDGT